MHWDNVTAGRRAAGHISGMWADLGQAAGSRTVGLRRIQVDPGSWATPAHVHEADEEIFYVLAGSGLSWQDGACFDVGAGDCLVHLAGAEAHTLRADDEGLDVLAFGTRTRMGSAHWPRTGLSLLGRTWVEVGEGAAWDEKEAAAGEPEVTGPQERPASIVHENAVKPVHWGEGERASIWRRNVSHEAGSVKTGLRVVVVDPERYGTVPHCHSSEEELFVVLDGDGLLELGEEKHPVRRGTVISRPAGTGVEHAMQAGTGGLTFLAYGTREPNDITYYPRSNKVFIRGVGLIGRVEPLNYWDGER